MSNNQMVSVPRELLERACMRPSRDSLAVNEKDIIGRGRAHAELREILTQPAEQHQGEPVAWRGINELGEVVTEWIDGAPPSGMVDLCGKPASFARIELAFTHADTSEVERLRENHTEAVNVGMRYQDQCKALRAQLVELRSALEGMVEYFPEGHSDGECFSVEKARAALSASAEQEPES